MLDKVSLNSYAARLINYLDETEKQTAHNLIQYIVDHAADFGLPKPTDIEAREFEAYNAGSSTQLPLYTNHIFGSSRRCPPALLVPSPENYLGGLLSREYPHLIASAAHAYNDRFLHDMLSIASFGITADGATTSFRMKALQMCADIYDPGVATNPAFGVTSKDLIATGVVQMLNAYAVKLDDGTTCVVEEKMTSPEVNDDTVTIALHPTIVRAIKGVITETVLDHPPGTSPCTHDDPHNIQTVVAAVETAAGANMTGFNAAVRSNDPNLAASQVLQAFAKRATRPVLIKGGSSQEALAQLLALQVLEFSNEPLCQAAIIHHGNSFLTAVAAFEPDGDCDGETLTGKWAPNPDLLDATKRVFLLLCPNFFTPVVHLLGERCVVATDLISLISAVTTVNINHLEQRAGAISAMSAKLGLTIHQEEIAKLAHLVPNPEMLRGVLQMASITGTACNIVADAERILTTLGVVSRASMDAAKVPKYDVRYVNCETPVEKIVSLLVPRKNTKAHILLYGAPGTSKSSLAAHLAASMGMKLQKLRYSDFAGKYVGETERRLREAFDLAARDRNFLLIDEADSVLRSRDLAEKSWERNSVNEMLTLMDTHDLPFACTTNYITEIDNAAKRRFTFKFELTALSPAQCELAWYEILKMPAATFPARSDFSDAAISDFVTTSSLIETMGLTTVDEITKTLLSERNSRTGVRPNKMGFN